ncbi:PucR family transcriptional regulator [Mycobacterium hubeiense]|uniref:PucR family transcriptional regulator n=1 Tax=Mycobacterium hubeiense TaxID=1867256 RepID=UPI0018EBB1D1|nr:helix-turn-helix domain-containing protein [Mycobacterium sp. QGD 101]
MARRTGPGSSSVGLTDLAELAARASKDAHGMPPELLDGYLTLLAQVSTGGQFCQDDLRRRRDIGARAAEQGVPMCGVIDLYLSATWVAWESLPGVQAADGTDALRHIGEAVFRAADTAIMAVAAGYEEAQRWSLRQEESFRRAFVDDLLEGRNLETLAERAERYGLRLAHSHVVVAIEGNPPFVDGDPVTRQVESAMHFGLASRDVLVTTKEGLLVCVAPDGHNVPKRFLDRVVEALGPDGFWRAGIGRSQHGPGGAVRSFEQARQALDIGQRLQLPGPVYSASDLLVYQVLIRDSAALADLVEAVLEPLRAARTGPVVLLDTVSAYFMAGGVATLAARHLHVGVRTVTYRLQRVKELTGYSVHEPRQKFTLQVAVFGARLLGWPEFVDRRNATLRN